MPNEGYSFWYGLIGIILLYVAITFMPKSETIDNREPCDELINRIYNYGPGYEPTGQEQIQVDECRGAFREMRRDNVR